MSTAQLFVFAACWSMLCSEQSLGAAAGAKQPGKHAGRVTVMWKAAALWPQETSLCCGHCPAARRSTLMFFFFLLTGVQHAQFVRVSVCVCVCEREYSEPCCVRAAAEANRHTENQPCVSALQRRRDRGEIRWLETQACIYFILFILFFTHGKIDLKG